MPPEHPNRLYRSASRLRCVLLGQPQASQKVDLVQHIPELFRISLPSPIQAQKRQRLSDNRKPRRFPNALILCHRAHRRLQANRCETANGAADSTELASRLYKTPWISGRQAETIDRTISFQATLIVAGTSLPSSIPMTVWATPTIRRRAVRHRALIAVTRQTRCAQPLPQRRLIERVLDLLALGGRLPPGSAERRRLGRHAKGGSNVTLSEQVRTSRPPRKSKMTDLRRSAGLI